MHAERCEERLSLLLQLHLRERRVRQGRGGTVNFPPSQLVVDGGKQCAANILRRCLDLLIVLHVA